MNRILILTLLGSLGLFTIVLQWLTTATNGYMDLNQTYVPPDVQNATLGFQKIYVLSMPGRTDKQDSIALAAYMSDLKIEFVDGVDGSAMPQKVYPKNWPTNEPPGTLGCWRGHMNIYQRMITERISSALIIEDDADWDINIKSQMPDIARGVRYVSGATTARFSPYGDEWDFFTTGNCGSNNHIFDKTNQPQNTRYWVTYDDPTVPARINQHLARYPNVTPHALQGNHTRMLFNPAKLTCTASYAITMEGAAQVLYNQALAWDGRQIDIALSQMCKYNLFNAAVSIYPPIFGQHRPAGNATKDSDRDPGRSDRNAIRKFAETKNIVFPTRLNFGAMLLGDGEIKSQFPGQTIVENIPLHKAGLLEMPTGVPVVIMQDEFILP